jgi:hypothetical protein
MFFLVTFDYRRLTAANMFLDSSSLIAKPVQICQIGDDDYSHSPIKHTPSPPTRDPKMNLHPGSRRIHLEIRNGTRFELTLEDWLCHLSTPPCSQCNRQWQRRQTSIGRNLWSWDSMDLLKGFFWASMVQQLLLLRILGEGSGLILLKERLAGRADNGLHVSL